LADYLPILKTYDVGRLDSAGVLQLVRAFLDADDPAKAAEVGGAAFTREAASDDDRFRWDLVRLLGPILRDRMGDPQAALDLWRKASAEIRRQEWRAECAVQAADIALNDLLRRDKATPLLEFARSRLPAATGPAASQLHRLWGDWHARGGQAEASRAAYQMAMETRGANRNAVQQNAWRGARSRSTEALLRDGELARARDELRQWQLDFPADKKHGNLSLLLARYWVASDRPAHAVVVASDLLTVNPASPYADQLLLLTAECEQKLEHLDRAIAGLQSLLTDYPGSPLTKIAEERLARLRAIRKDRP
jgi:TolA-binding protein